MAVAARPGPSDARVPCPLCGGAIHPIAGKCKHCKQDLTSYRAARPAASAPLPPLHQAAVNGHTNGRAERAASPVPHPPNAHVAHAVHAATATAHDVAVLPPRPTAHSTTVEPVIPAWRSWPVLVIVVAVLAIVAAVVLMLWPASPDRAGSSGKRALQPPPAPEHMQTAPDLRPQRAPSPRRAPQSADPWASPHQMAPMPQAPLPRTPTPQRAQPDDDNDNDLFGMPSGPDPGPNTPGTMATAMLSHMCRKMADCMIDDPMVTPMCERFAQLNPLPPPNCPAAARCLARIDAMTCGSQPPSLALLGKMVKQIQDCADATSC